MDRLTIRCDNCRQRWTVANTFSLYEQQAVESCPCPRCGAYTLCYPEPRSGPRPSPRLTARRRQARASA